MEGSSYDQLMFKCQELKENGYFDLAQKKLIELLQTKPKNSSDVVIEVADTLCLQGMYAMAFERVDNHLAEWAESESGASSAIRMMRAFSRAHAQGIFQDGFELIQVYEGMRSYGTEPETVDASVSSFPALLMFRQC